MGLIYSQSIPAEAGGGAHRMVLFGFCHANKYISEHFN